MSTGAEGRMKELGITLPAPPKPLGEWLSAADCASRTGLTVRALRVYEECGLISWRFSSLDVHREHGSSRCEILLSALGKIAAVRFDWDRPESVPLRT